MLIINQVHSPGSPGKPQVHHQKKAALINIAQAVQERTRKLPPPTQSKRNDLTRDLWQANQVGNQPGGNDAASGQQRNNHSAAPQQQQQGPSLEVAPPPGFAVPAPAPVSRVAELDTGGIPNALHALVADQWHYR